MDDDKKLKEAIIKMVASNEYKLVKELYIDDFINNLCDIRKDIGFSDKLIDSSTINEQIIGRRIASKYFTKMFDYFSNCKITSVSKNKRCL